MNELFRVVLSLSLSGSLVALALFALGPLWRSRLRKSWQYYVWLVVLLRLLLPVGPQNNLMNTLFSASPVLAGAAAQPAEAAEPDAQTVQAVRQYLEAREATPAQPGEAANEPPVAGPDAAAWAQLAAMMDAEARAERTAGPSAAAPNAPFHAADWLWAAWLAGAGALLVRRVGGYALYQRRQRRQGRGLSPVEDPALLDLYRALCAQSGVRRAPRLCYSDAVSSPMLTGVLRPRIILPYADAPPGAQGMRCVLLHELTHHRRRDILYKWLAQLTLCIHWFNPVVHLAVREIGRACELACDEAVIRTMDREETFGYGDTLIATVHRAAPKTGSAGSLALSEDARLLKERLGSILNYKNLPRYTRYLAVTLTVLLLFGALFAGVYAANTAERAVKPESAVSKVKSAGLTGPASPAAPAGATTTTPTDSSALSWSWGDREKFQTVTLTGTGSVKDIAIEVKNAGFRVAVAEGERISYEYREDLHEMAYLLDASGEKLTLTLDGTKGNSYRNTGREDTSVILYLPAAQWRALALDAVNSAVSLTPAADSVSFAAKNSAVSVGVDGGFAGSMDLRFENSAASVILDDGFQSFTVNLKGEGSAVSTPSGFPNYYLSRSYSHTVGGGAAKLDIALTNCAFSMAYQGDLDDAKSYGQAIASGITDGLTDWSTAWRTAWKDSGAADAVDDVVSTARREALAAAEIGESLRDAWSEVDWGGIWREAWEEADWETVWKEAWEEADWENVWKDAWEEAANEIRAEFGRGFNRVAIPVPLPAIDRDCQLDAYVDGSLTYSETLNPAKADTWRPWFSGRSRDAQVDIHLDGQLLCSYTLDTVDATYELTADYAANFYSKSRN